MTKRLDQGGRVSWPRRLEKRRPPKDQRHRSIPKSVLEAVAQVLLNRVGVLGRLAAQSGDRSRDREQLCPRGAEDERLRSSRVDFCQCCVPFTASQIDDRGELECIEQHHARRRLRYDRTVVAHLKPAELDARAGAPVLPETNLTSVAIDAEAVDGPLYVDLRARIQLGW